MDPFDWIGVELDKFEARQLRRYRSVRLGPQGCEAILGGRRLVNFGANDYLGLGVDPRVIRAARRATRLAGWGSGASPLITGRGQLHARLEEELAAFEQTEAALVFPSGFAANISTIPALVGNGDVVFSDVKNHASIIDGCRLSGATVFFYRHADVDHLRRLLDRASGHRRRLIVTDSLFSMDGDLAPLPDLADLAARHGAMLMLDEAHATGVWGAGGRGIAEHFGVEPSAAVRVGTCSKALGSAGGFVAGSRRLVDWLVHRARAYVFSTAMPEANCGAILESLRIVREEPRRRQQLLARAAWCRQRLRDEGWNTGSSRSQVIPILVGEARAALALSRALQMRGYDVPCIRPPSVPEGESLLRISLCHGHADRHIEGLLAALHELRRDRASG